MQDDEVGEHGQPEVSAAWPDMSAEASHNPESAETGQGISDDGATWRADQDSLQRTLDRAFAQPSDPSRRPIWTDTTGRRP